MAESVIPSDSQLQTPVGSTFYPIAAEINSELWDQYLPYQLVLVKALPDGTYVPTGDRFTLPIGPQELSVDLPPATSINATLSGVTIHHGGAPFRNIQLQGTTGINPRKNRGSTLKRGQIKNSIQAGSVQTTALKQLTIDQPNVNQYLTDSPNDENGVLRTGTGYYQMRLMERFIESYINRKSGADKKDATDLRMALCIWKDESVYLVEPLQFTKRRSASRPMEYTFSLVLKAWKRTDSLKGGLTSQAQYASIATDQTLASEAQQRFSTANQFFQQSQDVATAVVGTTASDNLFEGLRTTSLFLSNLSGAATTLSDMPANIVGECLTVVARDWSVLREEFVSVIPTELDEALRSGTAFTDTLRGLFDTYLAPLLSPDHLALPVATRRKVNNEKARVQGLGRADFETIRKTVGSTATTFADAVGAGSAKFASTYNLPTPTSTRTPTDTEMDVLYALNEACIVLDHLAASTQIDPVTPTSLEYVAGLAEASGIAFKIPVSKFAVPFPYGSSLEKLALDYLGDANRWHEIATLNGLRAPYVDETGFTLSLLTNGNQSTVVVGDRANLHLNQTVWLVSNSVLREKRHVTRIETVGVNQHLVSLDGNPDLAKFTTLAQAQLQAFLPGTVNSQQVIYIPSQNPAAPDPETKQIPGVDQFDPLLGVSGVDLLLTQNGDLAITPDGDCKLAFGLANIVQYVKIALSTPRGSLLQHPEFGLDIQVGVNTANVDAQSLLKSVVGMFSKDPTFSGVRAATVVKQGSTVLISLEVGVAGTSQFVPISVGFAG